MDEFWSPDRIRLHQFKMCCPLHRGGEEGAIGASRHAVSASSLAPGGALLGQMPKANALELAARFHRRALRRDPR